MYKGSSKHKEDQARWARDNREHVTAKTSEWRLKARIEDPKRFYMMNILNGRKDVSKKFNIPFFITKEYAMSLPSEICPVFGVQLEWGTGSDNTGSLDKIIPELGYVEGNVCWMSKRANILKRDSSREEIKLLHEWYEQVS